MKRGGRPKGPNCHHMYGSSGDRCQKSAQVRVTLLVQGSLGSRNLTDYRCWEHYVDFENLARSSDVIDIVRAEAIRPKLSTKPLGRKPKKLLRRKSL